MRCLDEDYALRTFPRAVASLPRREDLQLLVHLDGFLFLMDEEHYGHSRAVWLPIKEIWALLVRSIA